MKSILLMFVLLAQSIVQGKTATITIMSSDNVGVVKNELYIDSQLVMSGLATTYKWNIQPKSVKGPHILTAKAYDAAGNMASTSINIIVK